MVSSSSPPSPPTKYAIALFPSFQALDAFGPLDILNILTRRLSETNSRDNGITLYILAPTLDPVPTSSASPLFSQSVVPTHTYDNAPEDIEVLIVPGGQGCRDFGNAAKEGGRGGIKSSGGCGEVVEFLRARCGAWGKGEKEDGKETGNLKFLLTVCTGSAIAAKAGVLDGWKGTGNKRAFDWVMAQGPKVDWVHRARWVVDGPEPGRIWTSSGVSAGIDMMYAFVAAQYGEEEAAAIANISEYVRNTDANDDPFARE